MNVHEMSLQTRTSSKFNGNFENFKKDRQDVDVRTHPSLIQSKLNNTNHKVRHPPD